MTDKSHVERLADTMERIYGRDQVPPMVGGAPVWRALRAAIEADRAAGWLGNPEVRDLVAEGIWQKRRAIEAEAEVERLRAELDELREENADNWRHLHAARSRAATAEAERDEAREHADQFQRRYYGNGSAEAEVTRLRAKLAAVEELLVTKDGHPHGDKLMLTARTIRAALATGEEGDDG